MENQSDTNPETIRDFFDCIHKDYMDGSVGKVGYKFLADMLDGIQKTRSVNLTTIARGLSESIRLHATCLLYTSPSPRDWTISRMPSSA